MLFNFHYPIVSTIDADGFNKAVKQYVKINRAHNINQLIMSDQYNKYRTAMVKNYVRNGSRRANIRMSPYTPHNFPILVGQPNTNGDPSPVLVAPNFGINFVGDPANYPFLKINN